TKTVGARIPGEALHPQVVAQLVVRDIARESQAVGEADGSVTRASVAVEPLVVAATVEGGVGGAQALLQAGRRRNQLEGGARGNRGLGGPVEQRVERILDQRSVLPLA